MDRLSKLIFFALAVALAAFWSGRAHAAFAAPTGQFYTNFVPGNQYPSPDPMVPCEGTAAYIQASIGAAAPTGVTVDNVYSGYSARCRWTNPANGGTNERTMSWTWNAYCPANSTGPSGGQCTCNAGTTQTQNGSVYSCQPPNPTDVCTTIVDGMNNAWPGVDFTAPAAPGTLRFCTGGCTIDAEGATYYRNSAGAWIGQFNARYTLVAAASSCPTGSTAPPPAASAPQACPTGQCPGTVNGTSVCVPCAGASQTNTSNTTSTPSSASGVAGNPTVTNTSTRTTCVGESCTVTTTTTTTNGDGTSNTTNTTATRPRTPEDTPGDPAPSGPEGAASASEFGGSCSGAFDCNGDAIQCAIAQDQYRRHCQAFDTPNELSEVGTPAMTGASSPSGHPANSPNTVDLDLSTNINRNALFGGSTCPANVSTTVQGFALVLPLADLCDVLNIMGNIGVMVSLLAAAMIVFRSRSS